MKAIERDVYAQLRCIRTLIVRVQDDIGDLCADRTRSTAELEKHHDEILRIEASIDDMTRFFLKRSEG